METDLSAWWLPGGHLQSIYGAKLARRHLGPPLPWRRERWTAPDHDFIDVDWLESEHHEKDAPLLVLFHGLEGSSRSHYSQSFAAEARRLGWRFVLPHFRGCSGELNLAPRAYHSGDHAEIQWVLSRLRAQHSGVMAAVGVSLGGNALMHWAGKHAQRAHDVVDAVVAVCSPLDLMSSGHALGRGFNRWVYSPMFLRTMKAKAHRKAQQHPGLFDLDAAMAARTLYDFDDAFTAPVHGFTGVNDYWQRASAKPWLKSIALPALLLNPQDDPFVPVAGLPNAQEVSAQVTLWQPRRGGHVGFVGGRWPGHVLNMPRAVTDWLVQQLADAKVAKACCHG